MFSRIAPDMEAEELNREYDMYSRILAGNSLDPDLWYRRSLVVRKNSGCAGKLVFAVADLQQAIALSPNNRDYLASLQDALRRLGRNAERLAVLRQLTELEGKHSIYATIAAAIEGGRNEKMAVLRWAETNPLERGSPLDPGIWSYAQAQDLTCGCPSHRDRQDFRIFVDGRVMSAYDDIIKYYVRTTAGGVGELCIHADIASRIHQRPHELLRHANIAPDCPFHLVLVDRQENALASVGFSFCCTNGNTEITVEQLQGTVGSQPVLGSVRWEHLLLAAIERFAAERRCTAVRIVSSESNIWIQRMYRWMIERAVIPESLPLRALFEDGNLVEKARDAWDRWKEQEAKHPYFTRYIGFVDVGKMLLRYDKTARRRHYRPFKGPDGITQYWRKTITP